MAATRQRSQHNGGHAGNNKQAQLGNAYQELGKELGSEKLKVVGGYTIGRVIGEGTYGSVHLATHRLTGTRCAIKKIPKSVTSQLTREIHHHRRLHHAHIVHLHEILATETHVWLVTELCSGGELFDYLVERGRMLEGEARRLFGELAVAVGWMHRQGVVHRDLKLENVLLDGELRIKLGDLGFAREWQKSKMMETFCGTTGYASPEMLAGRKYLGEETDIWSLGIILYILLSGGLPFDDDDEGITKDLIMKGEYEEPDWLSSDARSLFRGMLQQDPSKRPSIEGILTHPWFKLTLVDKWSEVRGDGQSLPPTPGPCTPLNGHKEFDFSEPFRSGDPGPSSSRFLGPHSGLPSPLSTHLPQIPSESEPSETSFEFADSEQGKPDSGTTTPTTAEDEETELIKRNHSGELSHTEKVLELLHPNGSQSTIRRSGSESPGSATAFGVKNRVAIKSSLEGQTEVDEDMITDEEVASREQSASLPMMEEHSLHLPLAQHSRTPSRTKRRSVSSTLSLERRNSHHSQSGQWQTYPPEDYLAKLNEEREVSFSKPSERQLLTQLSDLGFDTGQLIHSVNSDACDASAAIWWILRQKQLERGETDEVVETRNVSVARRRDRAPANAREERRRARKEESAKGPEPETKTPNVTFKDQTTSIPVTPSVSIVDLGEPVSASGRPIYMSPEQTAKITVLPETPDAPPSEGKPVPSIRQAARVSETSSQPHTPPRELRRKEQLTSPSTASPSQSGKTRSPSVSSMLQRATSAIVGGSKKSEDPESVDKNDARSVSPTKPTKLPPNAKIARSESESTLLSGPHSSPVGSIASLPSDVAAPRQAVSTQRSRSPASSSTTHGPAPNSFTSPSSGADLAIGRMKASKRDSLWSTFRQLFIEDKRRRKGEISGSPLAAGDLKIAPAVVPSRGIGARAPHVNRVVQPISANAARRISIDVHPHPPSRRSSSVNSRRSSVTSMHLPSDLHEIPPALARRHSHKSYGSETPNSDREYQEPNRPSSAHSDRRGSSRRSSQTALRSPSMQSDPSGRSHQNSPLHNYQRSSPAGFASTRVRHLTLKAVPTAQGRTGSRASSVRSNASSRASSVDRGRGDNQDSDYDTRREDASMRSKRRKSSVAQLVQLIHRPRSPLTHPGQLHIQHPRHVSAVKRKAPLRDVFKHKNDDWVSEDDEPITSFAGGLGQGRTNTAANSGSNWAAAAAHPNALAKQHGRAHRQGHSRNRRGSSDEEKEKKGTVMSEVPNISGVKRTGLPDKMGRAPVIQEEEEEEE